VSVSSSFPPIPVVEIIGVGLFQFATDVRVERRSAPGPRSCFPASNRTSATDRIARWHRSCRSAGLPHPLHPEQADRGGPPG